MLYAYTWQALLVRHALLIDELQQFLLLLKKASRSHAVMRSKGGQWHIMVFSELSRSEFGIV